MHILIDKKINMATATPQVIIKNKSLKYLSIQYYIIGIRSVTNNNYTCDLRTSFQVSKS